jgi:hypothetical protein
LLLKEKDWICLRKLKELVSLSSQIGELGLVEFIVLLIFALGGV